MWERERERREKREERREKREEREERNLIFWTNINNLRIKNNSCILNTITFPIGIDISLEKKRREKRREREEKREEREKREKREERNLIFWTNINNLRIKNNSCILKTITFPIGIDNSLPIHPGQFPFSLSSHYKLPFFNFFVFLKMNSKKNQFKKNQFKNFKKKKFKKKILWKRKKKKKGPCEISFISLLYPKIEKKKKIRKKKNVRKKRLHS